MKVKGLDGKDYDWKFRAGKGKSGLHKRAYDVLREVWPAYDILEELPIPGAKKFGKLYLDLYIPAKHLAVEVHGEQHFKHIMFFHKSKRDFLTAQYRDRLKIEWLELNNIDLVELRFDEESKWRELLERRYTT